MRRYYKGQDRDVFRTLRQREDSDLQDTLSVYLRSAQLTAPWIGHQRRAGEREEDQRRHGGQHSKNLQLRGISWCEIEAAAAERTRWRYLAAHCPAKNRRN